MSDEEIWKRGVDLTYVIDAYRNLNLDDHFFRSFFEKLVGVDYVRKMIEDGKSAEEIKAMWQDDVKKFKEQRKPYLLYERESIVFSTRKHCFPTRKTMLSQTRTKEY